MPRPTLTEGFKFHTATQAWQALGLSKEEFNRRMAQGILPAPTYVNGHGLRFFDDSWLRIARAVIEQEREQTAERTQAEV